MTTQTIAKPVPAIEVAGVTKDYAVSGMEPTRALDEVSLDIQPGEFVSLIGPSGCGKTTLLRIIDGLEPTTSGQILIDGTVTAAPGPERAMVFQSFALLPWRTVRENIEFGLSVRGVAKGERGEIVDRYVSMIGLNGFEDRYPDQLSGGMQQRVGLARALAVNPQILLMDEPFGALDAQTRHLLQLDLERIWQDGKKSVVFVTHDMDEAVFLSDRIVIMSPRPGRIQEIIEVDLPRPRSDDSRRDPRFLELSAYVWEQLKSMIVRDGAQG
ncbi:ABC transporter ATP-binding protein [Compostimonas suwonensis]|uniref:ABC-type quaternary amine transporter n=1 Tax=Compostimonas suwonensis TaxID=1048394 RepID=A0A2M9BZU0_9MICO|nr:ABC transporter ATP-binding protein [Compostimonas suwonensis]PJJ63609.1 NitT/TauT family transport system ATP-binding protein [Compostimonas suwonensis]